MHLHNGDRPCTTAAGAMCHWAETAMAVGVRLEKEGEIESPAPSGRTIFRCDRPARRGLSWREATGLSGSSGFEALVGRLARLAHIAGPSASPSLRTRFCTKSRRAKVRRGKNG
nr:nucleotidyltransferase family protein [Stutzerimonas stutzeri]